MSKDISFGLLPFYKSSQQRDWQLLGYYKNWILALKYVPLDLLVSFKTPDVSGTVEAPSTMKLRKLKIIDGEATVLSEQIVTSGLVAQNKIIDGENLTYYYRQQGLFTESTSEYLIKGCIYDIYIEDINSNAFISDIFCAISETELYLYSEDNEPYLTEDGQQIIFQ